MIARGFVVSLELRQKVLLFQTTTALGLLFGLVAFSYNVWRLESTEHNSNVRTACFEILTELAELEQLIYAAHYDGDAANGSPRTGWVKVGLIADLSMLTSPSAEAQASALKQTWSATWNTYATDRGAVDKLVADIDAMRGRIKDVVRNLD